MLNFALDYRVPIDAITSNRDLNLRKCELEDDEWVVAKNLYDTLKFDYNCPRSLSTQPSFFSRHTPSISTVIPAMDHIDTHLATATQNASYSISIRAALTIGKQTLNRYYNKTDHSEVYQIAMVLHPCHKLRYFKTAGWEDEWIKMAHNIVREEFDRTYAFMDLDDEIISMNKVRKQFQFC
ncbi:hypothetical protein BYT27DRAFT_7320677 [Phlegmacium glaucopus]|nr:hypothetical protein BYT27DRAFT_7320677 [Phlegmacium glaucopus]